MEFYKNMSYVVYCVLDGGSWLEASGGAAALYNQQTSGAGAKIATNQVRHPHQP
jgi:hypothetical protein